MLCMLYTNVTFTYIMYARKEKRNSTYSKHHPRDRIDIVAELFVKILLLFLSLISIAPDAFYFVVVCNRKFYFTLNRLVFMCCVRLRLSQAALLRLCLTVAVPAVWECALQTNCLCVCCVLTFYGMWWVSVWIVLSGYFRFFALKFDVGYCAVRCNKHRKSKFAYKMYVAAWGTPINY